MKRRLCLLLLALAPASLPAAGGGELLQAHSSLADDASLQRGAHLFSNYCMGCHSARYMRYQRLGEDIGIPEAVIQANFLTGDTEVGDTMTIAMREADAKRYFGVAPPDLSVTARARGADWLYTYLMTFYRDPQRPTGVNNLAFKDTGMPHVLWELQGIQRAVYRTEQRADGKPVRVLDRLELESPGQMSAEVYAAAIGDMVNFVVCSGEPAGKQRTAFGVWVVLYLLVVLAVTWMLKKEYWRGVS